MGNTMGSDADRSDKGSLEGAEETFPLAVGRFVY